MTDMVIGTYELPGDNPAEPMYVSYSHFGDRVFVGDRANKQVVVFDADDFSVETTIPAGEGVFHMWADSRGQQLWVNNDIDNTATVIDTHTLEVIATVPMPADLVAMGGKPHDVILDRAGRFAYVTMLGASPGYVVQFDRNGFMETARAPVGGDPHLSFSRQQDQLLVASQDASQVHVLDPITLDELTVIGVPGVHGAWTSKNGKFFFTTNLPGGGTDGLFVIDTRMQTVIDSVNTPFGVPHNIVATRNKIYLTHSGGTSDKVTVWTIGKKVPSPAYLGDVTVGLNPFGLTFVP